MQNLILSEWLDTWKDVYVKNNVKIHTYSRYLEVIEQHIKPRLGDYTLDSLTPISVRKFAIDELERGNIRTGEALSPSSVNMIVTVLRLALDKAVEMGYITYNPCIGVKCKQENDHKVEAFTIREQHKIEAFIKQQHDSKYAGILICLYTGIRLGELLALTWENVDLIRGKILINKTIFRVKLESGEYVNYTDSPKTKSSVREIPMPTSLTTMLRTIKQKSSSKYIITNRCGGQMSTRSYQYIFSSLTKKLNIRPLCYHSLRHTFATRAIECGMDIKTVSEIMGHNNPLITMQRYTHCMDEHKKKMMNKLNQFYI